MKAKGQGRVDRLVAAGGVVFHTKSGEMGVILCGRTTPEQWRLPKGTPDPDETLEETALREVQEETGFEVQLVRPVGDISYWFVRVDDRVRCYKTVHFYLMKVTGGSPELHDHEFDVVCWFPLEKAVEKLAYPEEARIVEKAATLVSGNYFD